jgi:hypothetical protein
MSDYWSHAHPLNYFALTNNPVVVLQPTGLLRAYSIKAGLA